MCKQSDNNKLVNRIVEECRCTEEAAESIVKLCNNSEEEIESLINAMWSVVDEIMDDDPNFHNIDIDEVMTVIATITSLIQIPIIINEYKKRIDEYKRSIITKARTIGINMNDNMINNIINRIKDKQNQRQK